jgi:cytochrome c peroxidase
MRSSILGAVSSSAAMLAAVLLLSNAAMAQTPATQSDSDSSPDHQHHVPPYDPYPTGILPSDIKSELARVEREVDVVEARALALLPTLGTLAPTSNPPVLQGNGTAAIELLGELMNYDRSISPFRDTACASCHMPYVAFSGPIPSVNLTMIAYPGTYHYRAAKRTAQRYTYAPFFPVLQYNQVQAGFFGGNFWDSRATGYLIRNPDADQAQHPPVDPLEMGNPDTACIVYKLQQSKYRSLIEAIYGQGVLDIDFPPSTEKICATPAGAAIFGTSTTPVPLTPEQRTHSNTVFDHWGQALDAYEQSVSVSAFSSKFDASLATPPAYTLTAQEQAGYNLFRGKANCNSCHLDGRSTAPTPLPPEGTAPNSTDTGAAAATEPLFTCFGSANLGLPLNPRVSLFYETKPDFFGYTPNPYGFGYRDLGLGTFLRSGFGSGPNPNATWIQYAPTSDGQMQTSSARNVAMVPSQCSTTEAPGPYFQKEFFHNGYIKSLKQLVHFYNTRDVYKFPGVTSGHCPAGTTEKVDCWPEPEVPNNLDHTIGNLQLTDAEEDQIVAFLQTLTDGYTRPYPNSDTFTGACMTGGSASTQGNEYIIPTPPLPACSSAICGVAPVPGPLPIP